MELSTDQATKPDIASFECKLSDLKSDINNGLQTIASLISGSAFGEDLNGNSLQQVSDANVENEDQVESWTEVIKKKKLKPVEAMMKSAVMEALHRRNEVESEAVKADAEFKNIRIPLHTEASAPARDLYASVLINTVKETRRAEKDLDLAARELLLVVLTEEVKDSELTEYIDNKVTCELNFPNGLFSPLIVTRIGRLMPERRRLVKLSFDSPDSARLYKLAFNKHRSAHGFNFRLRNSLPPQMRHVVKYVFKLNSESDAFTSYSLRDSGAV